MISTVVIASLVLAFAATEPAQPPPADPQCNAAPAFHCLLTSARALETSMGFETGDAQAGQSACTPAGCLLKYPTYGCPRENVKELTLLEKAIEAVRSAACRDNEALLKDIHLAASCWDVDAFERCVGDSYIDVSKGELSKEQCSFYKSSVLKCIETSQKQCKADVKSASKLSSAFFSGYNCAPDDVEITTEKPTEMPKSGNSGRSLASSVSLTLSVGLVTALAIRR